MSKTKNTDSSEQVEKTRKWNLTFNNPLTHGFTHDVIKSKLASLKGYIYWCLCDEVGACGTHHTNLYIYYKNSLTFNQLKNKFPSAHIENSIRTHQENRDYIRKEGKWFESEKRATNLIDTFEESGEIPFEKQGKIPMNDDVHEMIYKGLSAAKIITKYKYLSLRIDTIIKLQQNLLAEKYRNEFRDIEVTVISGDTIKDKSIPIIKKFGLSNVYQIRNYKNSFDAYQGQDVITFECFEEFENTRFPISEMITYLNGNPTMFPCRTIDRLARHTKVFILSSRELIDFFETEQRANNGTWLQFLSLINKVVCFSHDEKVELTLKEYLKLTDYDSLLKILEAEVNSKK